VGENKGLSAISLKKKSDINKKRDDGKKGRYSRKITSRIRKKEERKVF